MAIASTFCDACPAYNPSNTKTGIGECRASIPLVLDSTVNNTNQKNCVWPIVAAVDWCVFGRVLTASLTWPGGT